MKETKAALRYATSLLDLALEQNVLDNVNKDMLLLEEICAQYKDFKLLLNSPIIKADKKIEILKTLFQDKISALSLSFIMLVTKKRREALLEEISKAFHTLYNQQKGISKVIITTAGKLDESLRKKVLELSKSNPKSEIELIENIDTALIGGFIIRIADQQIDTSIASDIKRLRRDFSENYYVKEY